MNKSKSAYIKLLLGLTNFFNIIMSANLSDDEKSQTVDWRAKSDDRGRFR
jgi:hypothetical protein